MVLLPIAYLPPVEWFARLIAGDAMIEVCDHYIKQTYRNRCHIATPNGIQALTIPVTHGSKYCTKDSHSYTNICISDQAHWRHTHWQALVSSYRMSPFFDYYADDLQPFYDTPRTETLYEYNLSLIRTVCNLMHINPEIRLTTHYHTVDECVQNNILDLRDTIHPKHSYTTTYHEYYQVFRNKTGFLPNLSIIDLLFNMGPEAILILNKH